MAAPVFVPIDQRFAQLIKQFGLTKNSFAISLGKTASVVQHLIDGRNKPGYDLLCKVFEIYPNVSRDWLLLGRGPMLVSGEHAPKLVASVVSQVPELPLVPIDLADVEVPAHRRPSLGVAGTRLQPAEIAATLALAAAANQPAQTVVSVPNTAPEMPSAVTGPATPEVSSIAASPPMTEAPNEQPQTTPAPPVVEVIPAPIAPVAPALPTPVAPAPAGPTPEIYVTAALNAQYLQHQLALAEMRNQHLVEQQQMLREMLAMARQAMV